MKYTSACNEKTTTKTGHDDSQMTKREIQVGINEKKKRKNFESCDC